MPKGGQSAFGFRGHSSVGRALEWHSRGQGFKSPWLHHAIAANCLDMLAMDRKIIGILRNIKPTEAVAAANAILSAGIQRIEVTLDSPGALDSIKAISGQLSGRGEFGAGTVLKESDVLAAAKAGASFIVSPDCNEAVIRLTKNLGLDSFPGVFTPTECFMALRSGADGLKMFPAFKAGIRRNVRDSNSSGLRTRFIRRRRCES